ncbi:MAG: DUF4080 domain-containing protein [Deltaproteobacteria bacterium]|nr:DUF4080 domain-containing protein [Deltaproteobacteria bacterium]
MTDIVLATLNARFIHASLGLRCLLANLGPLKEDAILVEGVLQERPTDFVERLLAHQPKLVGLGVYIWNIGPLTEVVQILKRVAPDVKIVLGGPEVSYELEEQPIVQEADFVIRREGESAFRELCERLLAKKTSPLALLSSSIADNETSTSNSRSDKCIDGRLENLEDLQFPYEEYSDKDIAHRVIYLEASRGCPFRCAFCLSALDKKVRPFVLKSFLQELKKLFDRGLRQFKFVDRTFNLDIDVALSIVNFFLPNKDEVFLHFEMIPDRLPVELLDVLALFPAGAIQLEVGFQTFNDDVAKNINRRTDYETAAKNIRLLRENTGVHIHADLIAGLPGESWNSFAEGFDLLYDVGPHEIQLGILKRLKGFPLGVREKEFGLLFHPSAPFEILSTNDLTFVELQKFRRCARFWDLVVNNGRFPLFVDLLANSWRQSGSIFQGFSQLAETLAEQAQGTHGIAQMRLAELIFGYAVEELKIDVVTAATALCDDFCADGKRRIPPVVRSHPDVPADFAKRYAVNFGEVKRDAKPARQSRHAS